MRDGVAIVLGVVARAALMGAARNYPDDVGAQTAAARLAASMALLSEEERVATSTQRIPITLVPGDGIGPEVTRAAQRIVEASGAPIDWEETEAGAEVFKKGLPSGVPDETIASLSRTRVMLKGPLETPGRLR